MASGWVSMAKVHASGRGLRLVLCVWASAQEAQAAAALA